MADKVSFTDFGTKRKVRKIKRKRQPTPKSFAKSNKESSIKPLTENSETEVVPNLSEFQFPFLEISISQVTSALSDSWCEIEVNLQNSGNGPARSIAISFDNLDLRGKTMVDELGVDSDKTINFEVKTASSESAITRMDVFYHTIEGDTFSIVRRDWFPNDKENKMIFQSEIPPGEEDKANIYTRKEVITDDFHIICRKCEARAPANFRICGKCGSRLQKRLDRSQDWGSNRKETTGVQDRREILLQKLRKLGELKDKGMLSDREFSAAKSQLLK